MKILHEIWKEEMGKLNYNICYCLALLRWFLRWYPFHTFGKEKNYSLFFDCGTKR